MRTRIALACLLALAIQPPVHAEEEGDEYVKALCTSCHGDELIRQQRLTRDQWARTVEKMAAWGAQADDPDTQGTLVEFLSKHYNPSTGPFLPNRISPQAAEAQIKALADGPFANGDPRKGKELYAKDCGGCHGGDARGELGLNLVGSYILYRAPDFAEIVRQGKGEMMPGRPMNDADVGNVLAYLRQQ